MSVARFKLLGPGTEERVETSGPGPVLSKAITRACASKHPGVWRVIEYEDELYVVERHGGTGLRVTIRE